MAQQTSQFLETNRCRQIYSINDQKMKSAAVKADQKQVSRKRRKSSTVNWRSRRDNSLGVVEIPKKSSAVSGAVSDDGMHSPVAFNDEVVNSTVICNIEFLHDSCGKTSQDIQMGSNTSVVKLERDSTYVFYNDDISSLSAPDEESVSFGYSAENSYNWEFINEASSMNNLEGSVKSFSVEQGLTNCGSMRDNLVENRKAKYRESSSSSALSLGGRAHLGMNHSLASTSSPENVHMMDNHWSSVKTDESI